MRNQRSDPIGLDGLVAEDPAVHEAGDADPGDDPHVLAARDGHPVDEEAVDRFGVEDAPVQEALQRNGVRPAPILLATGREVSRVTGHPEERIRVGREDGPPLGDGQGVVQRADDPGGPGRA